MSEDQRLVEEAGFGSMGSRNEAILIEKPVAVIHPSEETRRRINQSAETKLAKSGTKYEAQDIVGVLDESPEGKFTNQLSLAIEYASLSLSRDGLVPRINHKGREVSVIAKTELDGQIKPGDGASPKKQKLIVFCKHPEANTQQYELARKLLIERANAILAAFDIRDRLPTNFDKNIPNKT